MNIKDILHRYVELDMQVTAIRESIALISENFAPRDGIPPISIALTADGKRVPVQVFLDFIAKIEQEQLAPLLEEQSNLEEIEIE